MQGWSLGGPRLGCFGRQAGFGWVAPMRPTGQGPEPGHRLAPDPSEQSPVTIPSERAWKSEAKVGGAHMWVPAPSQQASTMSGSLPAAGRNPPLTTGVILLN